MNPGDALIVRVTGKAGGKRTVVSPAVGRWSEPPSSGALVGPGSQVGNLRALNRRRRLILPDGAAGRVEIPRLPLMVQVQYGEELFRLAPLGEAAAIEQRAPSAEFGDPVAGMPPGTRAVVAPTDGIFYRRSSPDSPPFVERGSRLRAGQPVGLVEVMKTFNQILYGAPGLPEEVEVLEIRCEDGEEVTAGQVLVVVR